VIIATITPAPTGSAWTVDEELAACLSHLDTDPPTGWTVTSVAIGPEEQNTSECKEVRADDLNSLKALIPDGWRVRALRTS